MVTLHNYSWTGGHGRGPLQTIHQQLSLAAFCFDQSMSAVGEESETHDNVSSLKGLQIECHEAKERKNTPYISQGRHKQQFTFM